MIQTNDKSRGSCPAAHGWGWASSIKRRLQIWSDSGLDLLYPPHCSFCQAELFPRTSRRLCEPCDLRLAPALGRLCEMCGTPLPDHLPAADCPQCRQQPLKLRRVFPLGIYRDDLQEAVIRMKHRWHDNLTVSVGKLMIERMENQWVAQRPDWVVPIPMFWTRRIVRGTNSAELLSEVIASHLRVPLARRMLKFCFNIKKQGMLTPRERFINVRGALSLSKGYDIRAASILLVDDVMTTGATVSEAARMLRKAGADRVSVTVAARAAGNR